MNDLYNELIRHAKNVRDAWSRDDKFASLVKIDELICLINNELVSAKKELDAEARKEVNDEFRNMR